MCDRVWLSSCSCGSLFSISEGQIFHLRASRHFKSDPSVSNIMLCLLFATIKGRHAGSYLVLCREQQRRTIRCIVSVLCNILAYKLFLHKCRYKSHPYDKADYVCLWNFPVEYYNGYLLAILCFPTTP